MLLKIPSTGSMRESLNLVSVYYASKFHPAEIQFPYIAILICFHDEILRNSGNICMLMHSNKVHIKSCFNEG